MAFADINPAAAAVDRLIADHGFRRVLAVLLRRLARGPAPPGRALADLPDHLRRDIGLPALPPHARLPVRR